MLSASARRCHWLLVALALLQLDAARPARAAAFNVSEPARGLFVHVGQQLALDQPGHDDIANLGFVVGTRCVAVIDSGGSPRVGRALRAAIRNVTALPVCAVINTHAHVDHVLGNAAFRDDHPQFIGHATLLAAMQRNREFFMREYRADFDPPADTQQVVLPDTPVAPGHDLDLDLGGRRLTLRAWPVAHSDSDLSVYDAASGTLFAGDLLFVQRLPALDGSLAGWLQASVELARLPARRVVPGHGPVSANLAAAVRTQLRYLTALRDGVRAAIARGDDVTQAGATVALAEKPAWLLWDQTEPHNLLRAFAELEWE